MSVSDILTRRARRWLTVRRSIILALGAATSAVGGCAARIPPACTAYAWTGADRGPVSRHTVIAHLDCDGRADTVSVIRAEAGSDAGLPEIVVHRGDGRFLKLPLRVDGLPAIVDLADLNGGGTLDIVLAAADESVALSMAVVLAHRDTLVRAKERDPTGVYYYDPQDYPDCDLDSLTPRVKRLVTGKLAVSWIVVGRDRRSQPDCHAPARSDWQVVGSELRRVR